MDSNGNPQDIDGFIAPMTWATLFGAKIQNVKKTGSELLDAMIAKARLQVVVLESPLGSDRGPQVDKYILGAGLDPTKGSFAWCVAFLCWCYQEAAKDLGVPNPMAKAAGVSALWNKSGG